MEIKKILRNGFLIFDGAMGTMLQNRGLKTGELPELYNIYHSDIVYDIHKNYLDAGADIVTTNTFGANRLRLKEYPYSVEEIIKKAVWIAKRAAKDKFVALDIGPTGQMMETNGSLSFDNVYSIFKEQVIAGKDSGVDLILIETMFDLYEAKAAVLAAKENSNLPVFCTMTFQENMRTLTGTDPITMVQVLEELEVDVLGLNCSFGPKQLQPIVDEIVKIATIPIMVQPNAGLPKIKDEVFVYELTPSEFADEIKKMAEKGVSIFGGCCGTTPDFIKAVKEILDSY